MYSLVFCHARACFRANGEFSFQLSASIFPFSFVWSAAFNAKSKGLGRPIYRWVFGFRRVDVVQLLTNLINMALRASVQRVSRTLPRYVLFFKIHYLSMDRVGVVRPTKICCISVKSLDYWGAGVIIFVCASYGFHVQIQCN